MRSDHGNNQRRRYRWGSLAVSLFLAWGQARAAQSQPPKTVGALAEHKAVFSDVVIVTNTPGALTNPARLGTLVQPRLVTNPAVVPLPASPTPALPEARKTQFAVQGRNMESLDSKQKLGVGDQLAFRVIEDQEDGKPLTITEAGELDVPELGLVPASGKTCRSLAYEIKGKLEQTTYYHATVILSITRLNPLPSGRRVYVSGYVQRPGLQDLPGGETWTVAKAIMRAGGFTIYADKKHVQLVRGQKGAPGVTHVVNMAEVLEKGRTDKDLAVEAEDFIIVPPRGVLY